jgi:hypothetical protein
MEDAAVAGLSKQERAARITELAGHLNAATHRWLVLIAEFDRRKGWSAATPNLAPTGSIGSAESTSGRRGRRFALVVPWRLPAISARKRACGASRGQESGLKPTLPLWCPLCSRPLPGISKNRL